MELSPTYWKAQLTLLAVHVDEGHQEQAAAIAAFIRTTCQDPRTLTRTGELVAMLGATR